MIKTTTTGNIAYLQSYRPYELPTGANQINTIEDCFSIDLVQNESPVIVNFGIGTPKTYITSIFIRNLTLNATLSVVVEYDASLILVDKPSAVIVPGNTIEFVLSTNNQLLNARVLTEKNTKLQFNIKNETTGQLLLRNVALTPLQQRSLPQAIVL